MAFEIIDGSGKSANRMIVDAFGRALVSSTSTTQEHHAAQIEEAYRASTNQTANRTLTLGAGFDGPIMSILNTNQNRRMSLQKILVGASAAGLILYLTKNPTLGAIGANTEIVPVNSNFAATKPAQATVNVWDEVGALGITGFTVGTEFGAVELVAGPHVEDIDGSLLIAATNTLLINISNPTAGAIEVSADARLFFEGV